MLKGMCVGHYSSPIREKYPTRFQAPVEGNSGELRDTRKEKEEE